MERCERGGAGGGRSEPAAGSGRMHARFVRSWCGGVGGGGVGRRGGGWRQTSTRNEANDSSSPPAPASIAAQSPRALGGSESTRADMATHRRVHQQSHPWTATKTWSASMGCCQSGCSPTRTRSSEPRWLATSGSQILCRSISPSNIPSDSRRIGDAWRGKPGCATCCSKLKCCQKNDVPKERPSKGGIALRGYLTFLCVSASIFCRPLHPVSRVGIHGMAWLGYLLS